MKKFSKKKKMIRKWKNENNYKKLQKMKIFEHLKIKWFFNFFLIFKKY